MTESSIKVLVFVVLVGLVLIVSCAVSDWQCGQIGEVSGKRTEYHVGSGCYIEVNGRLIPKDSWRGEEER